MALPPLLRQRYVGHLGSFLSANAQMLLIAMDTLDETQEHPYPIAAKEIKELFHDGFKITEVARIKIKNLSEFLYHRGYRNAFEVVYQLQRG